ncbi:MAG: bile acid:sodium symporter [Brachybacterium sp.]|nr:bile acid:sodium symporter [Brachybacterium sp.]
MRGVTAWMEDRQVALYLAAIGVGVVCGLQAPQIAPRLEALINPAIALLLFATFLAIPFADLRRATRSPRYLLAALTLNFVVVPVVVYALTRLIADDQVLLVAALFVLLVPCIDYVLVFTGLAGGDTATLLASTPILMLAQILLLPLYMTVMVGSEFAQVLEARPFIEAFVVLIVLPLLAAMIVRHLAGAADALGEPGTGSASSAVVAPEERIGVTVRLGAAVYRGGIRAMVPLMMLTLAVVAGSQIHGVRDSLPDLLRVIPLFVVFPVILIPLGILAGRVARLDVRARRSLVFTGVTRNSLVVLPLVLALPAGFELAPLVAVTQTLIELLVMLAMVRAVPRLVR